MQSDLRCSFVWMGTFAHLLSSEARFSFYAQPSAWKKVFQDLQNQLVHLKVDPDFNITLPWKRLGKYGFWSRYLRLPQDRLEASSNLGWTFSVPFREARMPKLSSTEIPHKSGLSVEGYYYRHGVTVMATLYLRGEFSFDDLARRAHSLYRSTRFTLMFDNNHQETGTLQQLAGELLRWLRGRAEGVNLFGDMQISPDPFTVTTLVQSDPMPGELIEERNHRLVHGLTKWDADWEYISLPEDVQSRCLNTQHRYRGQRVYASRHGRFIWSPMQFAPDSKITAKVQNYHRSLLLGGMQTGSMAMYLQKSYAAHSGNFDDFRYADHLARILYSLYTGEDFPIPDTPRDRPYRSWSVREQISSLREDLNPLFAMLGVPQIPPA